MIQTRKKRILGALLLGLLTLPPTLAIYYLTMPVVIILGLAAGMNGLDWFGNALLGLIAMAGDAIVVLASYLLFRSRALAGLTLATAIMTQAVAITLDWTHSEAVSARREAIRDSLQADLDHVVQGYAIMGAITYEVDDPSGQFDDRHPALGPTYRKLTLRVPVTVRDPGVYRIWLRYEAPDSIGFDTGRLQSVDTLGVGEHELSVQFTVGEYDDPKLWSPAATGGRATAQLSAKVDQAKLIRSYIAGKQLGQARLEVVKEMESIYNEYAPWDEMWVDSAVTEYPGGLRYPKESGWKRTRKPSGLTDKQEEELRLRKAGKR